MRQTKDRRYIRIHGNALFVNKKKYGIVVSSAFQCLQPQNADESSSSDLNLSSLPDNKSNTICITNQIRIISFLPIDSLLDCAITQQMQSSVLVFLYCHCSKVGQSSFMFPSLPCFCTFYRPINPSFKSSFAEIFSPRYFSRAFI